MPFKFMIIVTSITFLFLTYHYIELVNNTMLRMVEMYHKFGIDVVPIEINLSFSTYVLAYFLLITSFVLVSFLWYYITHLCVKMVGGKHGYDQTYKAMTYSLSADYLTLPAFIISFIALTISLVKGSLIAIIIFIIATILYLFPAFYRLYMRLIALERLQEISILKAFIAAYILAYIFVFIALIIIDVLIVLLFFLIFILLGVPLPF